ncbi:hypothetical protein PLEOSDRAFT_1034298, partial [Pleurotus ostreatus PC15]
TNVPFGVTYEKIGTIQRRLAWPLHKDDTLSRSGRPTGLNIYFWRCEDFASILNTAPTRSDNMIQLLLRDVSFSLSHYLFLGMLGTVRVWVQRNRRLTGRSMSEVSHFQRRMYVN